MNDLRDRRRLPHIDVTAANLKWYGCVTMLFYSVSMSVIQNGMLHVDAYSNLELRELMAADPDRMILSSWAAVFQLLGGLGIPVFAFALVEGFLHTKNYRNYLLRMIVFAAVSEIPFDFAMSGTAFDFARQNMLVTLSVCLVMLYGLRLFAASRGAQLLIVLASVLWCGLMRGQFGACMVLLAAVYYLLRHKPDVRLLLGGVISLMYVTGPISGFVLKRYNGQPGKNDNKYVFYCLYPLHLLVLGVITCLMA